MALDKPTVENINEADLVSLLDAGTPELKTLEYKQSLPGNSPENRKEFLADVSSFANSAGGHVIYGIRADGGLPLELLGLDGDADAAILRLESMIRDGIAPRIPVHSHAVKLGNARTAIIVRVPKSFVSPHMVIVGGSSRFFARSSNGKYQMDVQQIRAAFLQSETTAERIRDFRLDRLSRIRARETPVGLRAGPSVALHILPVEAFGSGTRYDVVALKADASIHQKFAPLFEDFANNSKINFDGLLIHQLDRGYLQLYRSGIIETVDATLISSPESRGHGKIIPSLTFEIRLFRSISKYLSALKALAVNPPVLVMLAFLDVRGYTMSSDNYLGSFGRAPFDRELLVPQEILLETYSADVPLAMKPLLDELWNAADFPASIYYKGDKWIGEEVAAKLGGV